MKTLGFTHEEIDKEGASGTDYTPVILPEEAANKLLNKPQDTQTLKIIESILTNVCKLKGRTYIKGSITNIEID